MGTTRDDFQSFGSLTRVIDMLNNLVMAGAMLWEVDFNILADMPSGQFDLGHQVILTLTIPLLLYRV